MVASKGLNPTCVAFGLEHRGTKHTHTHTDRERFNEIVIIGMLLEIGLLIIIGYTVKTAWLKQPIRMVTLVAFFIFIIAMHFNYNKYFEI